MNVTEALELADEWTKGHTFYERQGGWRVVVGVLAEEVRTLQRLLEVLTGITPMNEEQIKRINTLINYDLFINDE